MKKALSEVAGKVEIWRLGQMAYDRALALQQYLAEDILLGRRGDILLSLQHPPTITLGRNRLTHTVLTPPSELSHLGINVYYTERGGDATFHGPGQPILYPLVSLRSLQVGLRKFVEGLEDVMVEAADEYGIKAEGRVPFQTGCWIDKQRKLGAIGIRVTGGVTSHGLSFNANVDLKYYEHIVPCGIIGKEVTSLAKELGREVEEEKVADKLVEDFVRAVGYKKAVDKAVDLKTLEDSLERIVMNKGGRREWVKKADDLRI